MFWPDQAFRDLVVCLLVFGVMLALVLVRPRPRRDDAARRRTEQGLYEHWAQAGQRGLAPTSTRRPISTEAVPGPAGVVLPVPVPAAQVFQGRAGNRRHGRHSLAPSAFCSFCCRCWALASCSVSDTSFGVLGRTGLLTAVGALTCLAIADDTVDPLTRAVITRIGTLVDSDHRGRFAPAARLLWLLPGGPIAADRYFAGVGIMTVLLVGTGSLLYAALGDREIPGTSRGDRQGAHDGRGKEDRAAGS